MRCGGSVLATHTPDGYTGNFFFPFFYLHIYFPFTTLYICTLKYVTNSQSVPPLAAHISARKRERKGRKVDDDIPLNVNRVTIF